MKTARAASVLLAFAAVAIAFAARSGPRGRAELRPPVPPVAAVTPPPAPLKLPPPTAEEVMSAIDRAFGGAVQIAPPPRVLVGDLNGDRLEDLAVPVRPETGRLDDLNDGLANCWVQDALEGPPSDVPVGQASLAEVEPADVLLAVLHGYGPHGWRDDRARQCYLVRHATGAPFETRSRAWLEPWVGLTPAGMPLPGDVILASAGRRAGFVQWTGARYRWQALPSHPRAAGSVP